MYGYLELEFLEFIFDGEWVKIKKKAIAFRNRNWVKILFMMGWSVNSVLKKRKNNNKFKKTPQHAVSHLQKKALYELS